MANVKIKDITEKLNPSGEDLLVIHNVEGDNTRSVKIENILSPTVQTSLPVGSFVFDQNRIFSLPSGANYAMTIAEYTNVLHSETDKNIEIRIPINTGFTTTIDTTGWNTDLLIGKSAAIAQVGNVYTLSPLYNHRIVLTGSTEGMFGSILSNSGVVTGITYNIDATPTTNDEGSVLTMNVATTGFGDGTLYWTILQSSGTINDADFSSPASAVTSGGSVAITSNAGSFGLTLANDLTSEGVETFTVQLRTGSTAGTIVDTILMTITDTSISSFDYADLSPALLLKGYEEYFTSVSPEVLATNGQEVTRWGDKSGSSYDANEVTNKPTWNSAKDSIDFNGTNDVLSITEEFDSIIGGATPEFEIWFYGKFTDLSLANTIFGNWNQTTASPKLKFTWLLNASGGGNLMQLVTSADGVSNGFVVSSTTAGAIANTSVMLRASVKVNEATDADRYKLYKDATLLTNNVTTSTNRAIATGIGGETQIGHRVDVTGTDLLFFEGNMGIIILIPNRISDVEAASLRAKILADFPNL